MESKIVLLERYAKSMSGYDRTFVKTVLSEMRSELIKEKSVIKSIDATVDHIMKCNADLRNENADLRKDISKLEGELLTAKLNNQNMACQRIRSLEEEVLKTTVEMKHWMEKASNWQECILPKNEEIRRLQDKLKDQILLNDDIKDEVTFLQKELKKVLGQFDDVCDLRIRLEEEKEALDALINAKDVEIAELKKKQQPSPSSLDSFIFSLKPRRKAYDGATYVDDDEIIDSPLIKRRKLSEEEEEESITGYPQPKRSPKPALGYNIAKWEKERKRMTDEKEKQ